MKVSENNPIRVFVTHTFAETDDYLRVFEFLEANDNFFYLNVSKPENVPESGTVEALKDVRVETTVVGGRVVHECPSSSSSGPERPSAKRRLVISS